MASPTLTEVQAEKQSAALKKFHEDGKKGLAKTSAGSVKPPRALSGLSRDLKVLLPKSLDNIARCIDGDETVSKQAVDTSKWLVNNVMSAEKAALDDKLARLKLKAEVDKAKAAGLVDTKSPKEKAEQFGTPKLVIPDEWPEDESDSLDELYEEDEDE